MYYEVIDKSEIEHDELERNYSSRAGLKEPNSSEKGAQQARENSTLMAIYTSYADIPPSPREPPDPYTGDFTPEQSFGAPGDMVEVGALWNLVSHLTNLDPGS